MVNIVVRHSSSQLGSGGSGVKRSTNKSSYDRTVPSPIRIPSEQNTRAVSPLTTTESLFGGATAALQAAAERLESTPYNPHHSHHRPSTSSPVAMLQESRYGTPTRAATSSSTNNRTARDPSPNRGRTGDVRSGVVGGLMTTGSGHNISNNNHDSTLVEPEVDYDTDVTALYELLESSEWDAARLRCRTHPKEVRTWIVRYDGNSSKVRWKLLPLHAAVIFQAPTSVVTTLLDQYPLAAAKRDDQGMLPLHLAFRHCQQHDEALLELLLEQYPRGVIVKDRRDRYPLDHGKETQFSSHFMHVYANAHAVCQGSPKASNNNNENNGGVFNDENAAAIAKAVSAAATSERDKLIAKYETQLQTLKSMYEERIDNMKQEHRVQLDEAQRTSEEVELVHTTRHNQELDELRDLLSREVSNGQRVPELEHQVSTLKESLEQANQEMDMLRSVLHDQKGYEVDLRDHIRKILADQQALSDFVAQQQEQLEEAHEMREQILRTMMQKENDTWHKSSRLLNLEIAQVTESLRLRTESLLSAQGMTTMNISSTDQMLGGGRGIHRVPSNPGATSRDDQEVQEILNAQASGKVNPQGVSSSKESNGDGGGWGAHQHGHDHAHDDDISAITENSNF